LVWSKILALLNSDKAQQRNMRIKGVTKGRKGKLTAAGINFCKNKKHQ
jgi:hypothetical protein